MINQWIYRLFTFKIITKNAFLHVLSIFWVRNICVQTKRGNNLRTRTLFFQGMNVVRKQNLFSKPQGFLVSCKRNLKIPVSFESNSLRKTIRDCFYVSNGSSDSSDASKPGKNGKMVTCPACCSSSAVPTSITGLLFQSRHMLSPQLLGILEKIGHYWDING